jgi:hypothetical protein
VTYIYESPDDGHTVYRREMGSDTRELYIYKGSPFIYSYGMWADILKVALDHPALQEAVERVIILYELTKNDSKDH